MPHNNQKSKTALLPLRPVVQERGMVNEQRVSNWEGNYNYLLFAPFASLNLLIGERKQTTHCVRVPIVVNESVQLREQGQR